MGKDFSGNEPQAETQYEQSNNDDVSQDNSPNESLLDEVLANTIPTESEPLSPAELAALQSVAREHLNEPLELDPVGIELIDSLLELRMPAGVESLKPEMAESIATVMFESPEFKARLTDLWDQLCESVR